MNDLIEMLRTCRPAGSLAETAFVDSWLLPLGATEDKSGNVILEVGPSPRIMWASHTDTVHHREGRQMLSVSGSTVSLAAISDSSCLGADDTAGVWLMREMALARVPGLYIWHYGEERGGVGSQFIANQTPSLVKDIEICVSLDRYGTRSIITHQGSRCCSDAFADSLGTALGMDHLPDDRGLFTDSANYTHLIPECTNLSVGYINHHTQRESLDMEYLAMLRNAMLAADFTTLRVERDPADVDSYSFDLASRAGTELAPSYDLMALVEENPWEVAILLQEYGIDVNELAEHIYSVGGVVPQSRFLR